MPEVVVKYSGTIGALTVDGVDIAGDVIKAYVSVAAGHARMVIDLRGQGVDSISVDLGVLDITATAVVSTATGRVLQALVPVAEQPGGTT
jgi:hypothetical protein